jgi:excisionase family DNA binding protein
MSDNPLLDELCSRDTVAEILAVLDPFDLLIAYLRARGLSDAQIGAELGITKQSVWERMNTARWRLLEAMPDLRVALEGRRHVGHGGDAEDGAPLTVTAAARAMDVSRITVLGWIRDGRLPGAYREGRRWLIPRATLAAFRPPVSRRRPDLSALAPGHAERSEEPPAPIRPRPSSS